MLQIFIRLKKVVHHADYQDTRVFVLGMLKQLCGNRGQMVMHISMVLILSGKAQGKFPLDLDFFSCVFCLGKY